MRCVNGPFWFIVFSNCYGLRLAIRSYLVYEYVRFSTTTYLHASCFLNWTVAAVCSFLKDQKGPMASNSDIFDKIRIKPRGAKKKEEEQRAANECAWEGCDKPGTHKAPMGRNREGQYINFCIDHVRMYNKNFNYFSGLNDDEIAKYQKENITGHRPTWKMNPRKTGDRVDESSLRATPSWHSKVQARLTPDGKRVATGQRGPRKLKRLEEKSLRDLGLPPIATKEQIGKKYKALVKQHHPDANGGDRSSEERLRQIIQAYKTLRSAGLC